MSKSAPNLDAQSPGALRVFAERIQRDPLTAGQAIFPEMPRGYDRATCKLGAYASNKAVAMECRLRGDILAAQTYETICERLYSELPDFARW